MYRITVNTDAEFQELLLRNHTLLPFCKKGTTHKMSIPQHKQEGGSVLHMTNVMGVRIPTPSQDIPPPIQDTPQDTLA